MDNSKDLRFNLTFSLKSGYRFGAENFKFNFTFGLILNSIWALILNKPICYNAQLNFGVWCFGLALGLETNVLLR